MVLDSRLFTPTTIHAQRRWARPLSLAGLLLISVLPTSVHGQSFEVYCTNNSDGTTSCSGWEGGETLTCVNNIGGTSSCSTGSGRGFVCIRESGGVATCRKSSNGAMDKPLNGNTDCTFTGEGNFTCTPPQRRRQQLIPGPVITQPVIPDRPSLINPSVDLDLIQPLSP